MSDSHAAFVGSIPENYDRYLGPCLFEPYASDIVEINQRAAAEVAVIESVVAANVAAQCGDNPVKGRLQAIVFSASRPTV